MRRNCRLAPGIQKLWPIFGNQPDEAYSQETLMKAYK